MSATMRLLLAMVSASLMPFARGGSTVAFRRSLVEASANPIRRVVTLLEKMAKKVEAEGEEETALYEKFSCYCSNGAGDLAKSIAENTAKVPQVQSDIEASSAELAQLQGDLKGHQEDRSAAKTAIEAATAQREKENAAYVATSGEYKSYIDSLATAIPAIQKGMAGAFLQRSSLQSAQSLRRAVADASDITDYDRQMVTAFLENGGRASDGYTPVSGEIVGILNQIKEDFEKSLADVEATEAEAVKLHEELIAAKDKQVSTLSSSVETKTVKIGELQVEIVNMKNDLSDTEAALLEDQKMAADLKGNCESKAAEWEERKKLRAEELMTIHETIKILNDDDALELFKKTLPSASLLQLGATNHQVQLRALRLVQAAQARAQNRPGLDFLTMALSGKKVDFSKVMKMIDDMVAILAKEQEDDDHKKEYCGKQIDYAEDKAKELSKSVDDFAASVAEKEELMAAIASEIKDLTAGVGELDKSVSQATEQRKKEHAEYLELMKSNGAAKELLAFAKNRLNKFYNPSLHITTTAPPLSREDEIMANSMAGLAFVQVSRHSQQKVTEAQVPETWGEYKTKGQETGGVISMLDLLIRELDKEMTEAETTEKNAQAAYETMTSDAAAKRASDMKLIGAKEAAKADAEVDKTAASEAETETSSKLMATKKYEMELHQDCDWLMQNFDLRKEARASEGESLKEAKAVLAGSDFSLVQRH